MIYHKNTKTKREARRDLPELKKELMRKNSEEEEELWANEMPWKGKMKWKWKEKKRREKSRINRRWCVGKPRWTNTKETSWPYMCHVENEASTHNKCAEHGTRSNEWFCSYLVSQTRIWTSGQLMSQKITWDRHSH